MEAASSFTASANIYQTTRHLIAKDFFLNRNQHRCDKLTYLAVLFLMAGVDEVVRADYQYLPFHTTSSVALGHPPTLLPTGCRKFARLERSECKTSTTMPIAWSYLSPPFIQVHGMEFRHRHILPLPLTTITVGIRSFFDSNDRVLCIKCLAIKSSSSHFLNPHTLLAILNINLGLDLRPPRILRGVGP
jgi:hypothetical protein